MSTQTTPVENAMQPEDSPELRALYRDSRSSTSSRSGRNSTT